MRQNTLKLVQISLIAALYATLTLAIPDLGFGGIQFRVSEALTLLAIFSPTAVAGLTFGCFLSNLVGLFLGKTLVLDIVIGPIATLLAGVCAYSLRRIRLHGLPLLSAVMPAIWNGLMIGTMVTAFGTFTWQTLLFYMGTIAASELIICCLLGLPLIYALERSHLDKKLFGAVVSST